MGEHCSVCWRKFFTKDMHLNWLRMNRRVDSKWLKISNQPLHLYPLLHLYICLWVCAKLLQSCPTLCDPVDCSPPGSSVHRILRARILDWVDMPSSKKYSWPRNWNHISCRVFTTEPLRKHLYIHIYAYIYISSVVQLCLTLCNPMDCSIPALTNPRGLLKLIYIESVMPSNHLILCRPLLLLPSVFPSIRVFSNESVLCIRWPKYWSFSFSFSPSNEYPGLISFRMDWLDLLAVQGTLKSLLQQHNSKASILLCSAFFMVQLSHPY